MLDTQTRRRHLSYTHLKEMMHVWGLAELLLKIIMYRTTTDKTYYYLETPQTMKMTWYPSEFCSQQAALRRLLHRI